ncbi:MAG: hypothetical protein U0Q16_19355 [Bryobacteraceae bacterium]
MKLFFFTLPLSLLAAAQERESVIKEMGPDYFTAGKSVAVTKPVGGDLFAAGQDVAIDAPTAGDAVAAGGSVRINGSVEQHVYAAGGRVTVNGVAKGGARIAGGEVDIAPAAEVRNLSVAGGQVRINGAIAGYLQAAGGRVYINAPVSGDADISANRVELGPAARIGGKLRYRSREALVRDPAAVVSGSVEQLPMPAVAMTQAEGVGRAFASVASWIWTLGLIVVIAVLIAVLPKFFAATVETLEHHLGASALTGFVLLVCVPVAALLLLITGIGAPLGFLAIGSYLALLMVGYLTASAALGDVALKRWIPAHAGEKVWRIGAAAVAMLVISVVGQVPLLGGLIVFAALLAGFGALALEMKNRLVQA